MTIKSFRITGKLLVCLHLLALFVAMANSNPDQYETARLKLLKLEKDQMFYGNDELLTGKEVKINEYLLEMKLEELQQNFLSAENFLIAKNSIDNSKVFELIKKLPKGSSLHTHLLASVNTKWIIKNLTYNDNIYACYTTNRIFKLKVLKDATQSDDCHWKSLKQYRAENADFDMFLEDQMKLGLETLNQSRDEIWIKFKNTFSTIYDLVAYRPIFEQYVYRLLEELYLDNVFYVELRGTFMPLYDLKGTKYNTKDFFEIFINTIEKFKSTHSNFIGAKYIHSIYRGVDNTTLRNNLQELQHFRNLFPNFIIGFDFVGREEDGKNLTDFHKELLEVSNDLKFYFHAGETYEFGRTDLNLIDVILLNVSRIGHGFALAKHPKLLKIAKQKNIPVELCPISNQVLKLINDYRNHPVSMLLSIDYPVIIGNDDPAAWNATGLSYDWYVTFMSMTWEGHGLEILKKFAKNSIKYSAFSKVEYDHAMNVWEKQWSLFLDEFKFS